MSIHITLPVSGMNDEVVNGLFSIIHPSVCTRIALDRDDGELTITFANSGGPLRDGKTDLATFSALETASDLMAALTHQAWTQRVGEVTNEEYRDVAVGLAKYLERGGMGTIQLAAKGDREILDDLITDCISVNYMGTWEVACDADVDDHLIDGDKVYVSQRGNVAAFLDELDMPFKNIMKMEDVIYGSAKLKIVSRGGGKVWLARGLPTVVDGKVVENIGAIDIVNSPGIMQLLNAITLDMVRDVPFDGVYATGDHIKKKLAVVFQPKDNDGKVVGTTGIGKNDLVVAFLPLPNSTQAATAK